MELAAQRELLKKIVAERVYVTNSQQQIDLSTDPQTWLFDFRKILLNGTSADLISTLFYEMYKTVYPFQLCTLETGGIPLVTSLMNKFYEKGHTDANAVFIRKSRKKTGLLQMIEGEIQNEKKIILVDDIMNSGNSFWRQIEVLEEMGYNVNTVWSIIRYRDHKYYKRFHNRGIQVHSLFTLDDFTEVLGERVKNILSTHSNQSNNLPFKGTWKFKSENPSLSYVVSKSQPVLDEDTLFVGSDNEVFWALNQVDGSIKWKYKVGPNSKKKSIFSNPALHKDLVIFGSYDGNVYALNKKTGERKWISFEADWVGSSPAIAADLNLIFIGLEFGLFRRHGGIAALDADTGETAWTDYTHSALTHCSPHYIEPYQQVVIGSNDGVVRMYDARTGKKLWEFTTFGGGRFDKKVDAGFGEGEIKESFAYDAERDYIIFGAMDGLLYILDRASGNLVHHFTCTFGIWATPYIFGDRVYFSSLDKHVRCIELENFELVFEKNIDGTRIFSSPIVINDRLYIGTNAGRLHELDPRSGNSFGYFQTLERITNNVVYNPKSDMYFLPTYANEILCLKRETT